jgi:hypothetical protein
MSQFETLVGDDGHHQPVAEKKVIENSNEQQAA